MSGQSGKGNSSAATTQQVSNQQVATESGIAIGANSQASINVQTSDPDVVRASIAGNVAVSRDAFQSNAYVTDSALTFAGRSAEIAANTNRSALEGIERIAGTSILSSNDLSTKFIDGVGAVAAQNINLLGSLGQQQTDTALAAQNLASRALDQSFAVSRAVAPQDSNFSLTELAGTASKTILYSVLGIAAIIFGLYFFSRKRA